jgi:hypothetical protein
MSLICATGLMARIEEFIEEFRRGKSEYRIQNTEVRKSECP